MGAKKIVVVVLNEMVYLGDGKSIYGDVSKKMLGGTKWDKLVQLAAKQEAEREEMWQELGLSDYCKTK